MLFHIASGLAVAVEDLHPVALAVRDVDPIVFVDREVVRDHELPDVDARLAPGQLQFALGRVAVDARVAVAVADEDRAVVRGDGGVRRAVEGLAAVPLRGHPRLADGEHEFALARPLRDRVGAVVGAVEEAVRPDADRVRAVREHARPEAAQDAPARFEHDDRVIDVPREQVDQILGVDGDAGALVEGHALGQLLPRSERLVTERPTPKFDRAC